MTEPFYLSLKQAIPPPRNRHRRVKSSEILRTTLANRANETKIETKLSRDFSVSSQHDLSSSESSGYYKVRKKPAARSIEEEKEAHTSRRKKKYQDKKVLNKDLLMVLNEAKLDKSQNVDEVLTSMTETLYVLGDQYEILRNLHGQEYHSTCKTEPFSGEGIYDHYNIDQNSVISRAVNWPPRVNPYDVDDPLDNDDDMDDLSIESQIFKLESEIIQLISIINFITQRDKEKEQSALKVSGWGQRLLSEHKTIRRTTVRRTRTRGRRGTKRTTGDMSTDRSTNNRSRPLSGIIDNKIILPENEMSEQDQKFVNQIFPEKESSTIIKNFTSIENFMSEWKEIKEQQAYLVETCPIFTKFQKLLEKQQIKSLDNNFSGNKKQQKNLEFTALYQEMVNSKLFVEFEDLRMNQGSGGSGSSRASVSSLTSYAGTSMTNSTSIQEESHKLDTLGYSYLAKIRDQNVIMKSLNVPWNKAGDNIDLEAFKEFWETLKTTAKVVNTHSEKFLPLIGFSFTDEYLDFDVDYHSKQKREKERTRNSSTASTHSRSSTNNLFFNSFPGVVTQMIKRSKSTLSLVHKFDKKNRKMSTLSNAHSVASNIGMGSTGNLSRNDSALNILSGDDEDEHNHNHYGEPELDNITKLLKNLQTNPDMKILLIFQWPDNATPLTKHLKLNQTFNTDHFDLISQLADALAHLHSNKMAHGSLMTKDVIVFKEGNKHKFKIFGSNFHNFLKFAGSVDVETDFDLLRDDPTTESIYRRQVLNDPPELFRTILEDKLCEMSGVSDQMSSNFTPANYVSKKHKMYKDPKFLLKLNEISRKPSSDIYRFGTIIYELCNTRLIRSTINDFVELDSFPKLKLSKNFVMEEDPTDKQQFRLDTNNGKFTSEEILYGDFSDEEYNLYLLMYRDVNKLIWQCLHYEKETNSDSRGNMEEISKTLGEQKLLAIKKSKQIKIDLQNKSRLSVSGSLKTGFRPTTYH